MTSPIMKRMSITDDIVDYKEIGEYLLVEVPNFNGEEVDYVDFFGMLKIF
jgi:hypothetical protein